MKKKRLRYSRKRTFVGLFLFLFLIGIVIGYASVTTKLEIDGIIHVKDARWDVHFANFQTINGSVSPTVEPSISGTSISFAAKVNEPGDFYGFTIDIVNQGTINADVSSFSLTPDFNSIDYIDAEVSYINGESIVNNDILVAGTTKRIKVILRYKDGLDENLYPITDQSFNVSLTLNYEQNTDYVPNFQNDSWTTIKANVLKDKKNYPIGATKTFEMDLNGDNINETYTLRVANNTTPSECNQNGFSKTACGFVLEFQNIISMHKMNLYTDGLLNGNGNKGGWEYSDLRAYLNSTIYVLDNTDYSTTGVYDKLPSNIKNSIISTTVVSGYGQNDLSNTIVIDNLYLLSTHEVWLDEDDDLNNGIDYCDNSYGNTRQLDYYREANVTTLSGKYTLAIKSDLNNVNSDVWLRSARLDADDSFFFIGNDGYWYACTSYNIKGVSPAFRIAE